MADKNAKLLLYPAKRKSIEGDLATKDLALETYIAGAQNLLVRFGAECRASVEKRIASLLTPYISEQHRVDALAQTAGSYADLPQKTNHIYGAFSQSAIQEVQRDGRSFQAMAQHAVTILDGLPALVEEYTSGKAMANA